eukprot:SAG22_NODE_13164_length_416_cov_1.302839_1_plen_38_part_10
MASAASPAASPGGSDYDGGESAIIQHVFDPDYELNDRD